jgi:hypothetical protein
MDSRQFEAQMGRLRSQWPSFYGADRTARIYSAFREMEGATFTQIVDLAIDRYRAAPLLEDLSKLEHDVRRRQSEERASAGMREMGLVDVLDKAQRNTRLADPAFVKACRSHLNSFLDRRISKEAFDRGVEEIQSVARKMSGHGLSPQERAAGKDAE